MSPNVNSKCHFFKIQSFIVWSSCIPIYRPFCNLSSTFFLPWVQTAPPLVRSWYPLLSKPYTALISASVPGHHQGKDGGEDEPPNFIALTKFILLCWLVAIIHHLLVNFHILQVPTLHFFCWASMLQQNTTFSLAILVMQRLLIFVEQICMYLIYLLCKKCGHQSKWASCCIS